MVFCWLSFTAGRREERSDPMTEKPDLRYCQLLSSETVRMLFIPEPQAECRARVGRLTRT